MTSGTPPARKDAHGRVPDRPVGQGIDEPWHPAVDGHPVLDGGPPQPGVVGDGGDVQQQVGRAAEGGVDDHRVAHGGVREDVAGWPARAPGGRRRRGRSGAPMSSQIGWPEGASAECGSDRPSASPTTCEVAAVPRNWQPPPGEAQALQPSSAASSSVMRPWAKRAPMLWILPASSPSSGGRVTPPGTSTQGRWRMAARAIIMAGRPLSQVATPTTPLQVGSERMSRRSTRLASLR